MVLGVVYVTHCQWWLSVQPYDEVAIFTGSTTIVDGKMVIIYPGLCVKGIEPDCDTGTLLASTTRTSFLLAHAQLCSLLSQKAASLSAVCDLQLRCLRIPVTHCTPTGPSPATTRS